MTRSWKPWRHAARFAAAAAILGIALQPMGQSFAKPAPAAHGLKSVPAVVTVRNLPTAKDTGSATALPFLSSPNLAAAKAAASSLAPGPGIQRITRGASPEQPTNLGGFQAVNYTDTTCGCLPPDGANAVGPSDIMTGANTAFKIFSKTGTLLKGPTEFKTFFGTTCNKGLYSDPGLDYDNASHHFVMDIITYPSTARTSLLCIAVSQTTDPTGTWNLYAFTMPTTNILYDFPHMAIASDSIFVTGNEFLNGASFNGVLIFAIKKADLYAGKATTAKTQTVASTHDTLMPARTLGTSAEPYLEPGIFVAVDSFSGCPPTCSNAYAWAWQTPFGTSKFTALGSAPLTSYAEPVSALSSDGNGGTITVNTDDTRDLGAWIFNKTVYSAHTISCNPGGGTVDCVQWFQLNLSNPISLIQQGIVSSNNQYRYYPNLAVDKQGNVILHYAYSSPTDFIGINYTGRLASDPTGTMEPEAVLQAGLAPNPNASSRWGDYAETGIDADGCDFYTLEEYSPSNAATNIWSTWNGHTKYSGCS